MAATLKEYAVSPASAPTLEYRPLQDHELSQAHALSAALQWPNRLEDWRFGWRLGIGEAAWRGTEMVGVALRWHYGGAVALGHIIVSPAHQGYRIGSTLVSRALAQADAPAALLHATPAGAGVYARLGFGVVGQLQQHQGVVPTDLPAGQPLPLHEVLRPLTAQDRAWAITQDTAATGMRRDALIGTLVDQAPGVVLMRDGARVGYSVVRRAGFGWVVGPIIGPDLQAAQALARYWLARHAGKFLRVDTAADSGLGPWLIRHGLPRIDLATIMARGPLPVRDPRCRAYALVSQALG